MGSVNSVNPGVASLLQILSGAASPALSSTLSSQAVQTALQNASPSDLVKLSQAALQSQVAGALFASPESSQTATDPASLLIQAADSSITGTSSGSSTVPSQTTANSNAAATTPAVNSATALELQEVSELFGTNSNSSVNVLA